MTLHPTPTPIPYQRIGILFLVAAIVLLAIGLAAGTPFFVGRGGERGGPAHREEPAHVEPPAAHGETAQAPGAGHDFVPPVFSVVPFAAILLAIAIFPLVPALSGFWESNRNKLLVSAVLGGPVAFYIWQHDPTRVLHTGLEYSQFLALLTALFIVAGGIHLTGNLEATPRVNTTFLAVGYVLASIIGTTGAAMVLIYPLLRTNTERRHKAHTVIFFIFLVCNIGGLLTPLGDPPLFLGYLRGIEFFWFMKLLPLWAALGVVLLGAYFALDVYYHAREPRVAVKRDIEHEEGVRLIGVLNVVLLMAIVGSVAASVETPYREAVMAGAAGLSLSYAHASRVARRARDRNHFSLHAILEVAAVFAGIFAAMMPALILLKTRGAALGVDQPLEFFYATGLFSSFLDNAPTFLVFLELALGVTGIREAGGLQVGQAAAILGAISAGAVCMGANTYIGNAPNFMVRSIAEQRHVKMPSFFGYMVWALVILIPAFSVTAVVFFKLLPFPLW